MRVWIHWVQGAWVVTPDGMSPVIESTERIVLRDVTFVIDPIGIGISRRTGKAKTHAWAIGERVEWTPDPSLTQIVWHPLAYRPRSGDDHFTIRGGGPLEGVQYLEATLNANGKPIARVSGPRYGETERRRVQQYGGIR